MTAVMATVTGGYTSLCEPNRVTMRGRGAALDAPHPARNPLLKDAIGAHAI